MTSTSFFKLAGRFSNKIIFASNVNLMYLQKLITATLDFCQTKDLWMTSVSDEDIYDQTPDTLKDAFSKLETTAKTAKSTVGEYGLSQSGYADVLKNISDCLEPFASVKPLKPLDPTASNKLDVVKTALHDAESNYTPVAIPAVNPQAPTKTDERPLDVEEPAIPSEAAYENELGYDDAKNKKSVMFDD